jgi:glycosyltransferase involved in cell wall biosynthesis
VHRKQTNGSDRSSGSYFWQDKLEMTNHVLHALKRRCVLVQIDADELWTAKMILRLREFMNGRNGRNGEREDAADAAKEAARAETDGKRRGAPRECAYFDCHFFIAPGLITVTKHGWSHRRLLEWRRAWRIEPGRHHFIDHSPPILLKRRRRQRYSDASGASGASGAEWEAMTGNRCANQEETEAAGLVFSHYAYHNEQQLRFKELYYGFDGLTQQWKRLRSLAAVAAATSSEGRLRVGDYISALNLGGTADEPTVFADRSDHRQIGKHVPIVPPPPPLSPADAKAGLCECGRVHVVVDGVINQIEAQAPSGISRVWRNLLPAIAKLLQLEMEIEVGNMPAGMRERSFPACLTFLQRTVGKPPVLFDEDSGSRAEGGTLPMVRLRAVRVPPFDEHGAAGPEHRDEAMLRRVILNRLQGDTAECTRGRFVFISTSYTRVLNEGGTRGGLRVPHIVLLHDLIPEAFGWQTEGTWADKKQALLRNDTAAVISVSQATFDQLGHFYPQRQWRREYPQKQGRQRSSLAKSILARAAEQPIGAVPVSVAPNGAVPVSVAPNGVDCNVFRPVGINEEDMHTFQQLLLANLRGHYQQHEDDQLPRGSFVLLVGRRLGYKNGWLLYKLLSEWHHWADSPPPLLVLVGPAVTAEEEELLDGVRAVTEVAMLGRLPDKLLAAAYSAAAALVYASTAEGFGLPPLEASVCGCPVIAMRTPALTELGKHLFLYLEPEALAGVVQGGAQGGVGAQEKALMQSFVVHLQHVMHLQRGIGQNRDLKRRIRTHGRQYCGWSALGKAVVAAALEHTASANTPWGAGR